MYVNKWHTFGVSALLQCTAGVSYCFAIYAGALKESLGLTQAQVGRISTRKSVLLLCRLLLLLTMCLHLSV